MLEHNEHTLFDFEYAEHGKKVKITANRFLGGRYQNPCVCYVRADDILWILNTIRGTPKDTFKDGYNRADKDYTDDDFIILEIHGGSERNSLGLVHIGIINDNSGPSFGIEFDCYDPMNPEDSLYKFLMQLEGYVPESDKSKIIPAWR